MCGFPILTQQPQFVNVRETAVPARAKVFHRSAKMKENRANEQVIMTLHRDMNAEMSNYYQSDSDIRNWHRAHIFRVRSSSGRNKKSDAARQFVSLAQKFCNQRTHQNLDCRLLSIIHRSRGQIRNSRGPSSSANIKIPNSITAEQL